MTVEVERPDALVWDQGVKKRRKVEVRVNVDLVTRPPTRADRPILLPSEPVSEGIEIRQGCQFISSLFRALGGLCGGLGRFIPCIIGGHMSRLRHFGVLKVSRPGHQKDVNIFVFELCVDFLRYP